MDKSRVKTIKRSRKMDKLVRRARISYYRDEIKSYFLITAACYLFYRIFIADSLSYAGFREANLVVGFVVIAMFGAVILYFSFLSSNWRNNEDIYKDMDDKYIGRSKDFYYFATALSLERSDDAKRKIEELEEIINNRKKGIRGNVAIVYKVRKMVVENLKRKGGKEERIDILYDMILEYANDDKFKLSDDPLAYVFEKEN